MTNLTLGLNDLSDRNKFFDELSGLLCVTSSADKPRYVDLSSLRGGLLGFTAWADHWNKASGVAPGAGGGSLAASKYFSLAVMPVNSRITLQNAFKRGQPCAVSVPVQVDGTGTDIINWSAIPTHDQEMIETAGTHTGSDNAAVLTDDTKSWATSSLVGMTIRNLTDGSSGTITANTGTTITIGAGLSGGTDNDFDTDDEYQVVTDECDQRWLYVSQGDTAAAAWAGPFYFQEVLEDNTTTTWSQTSWAVTTDILSFDRLPPASAMVCKQAYNKMWYGGGVFERRGKCAYQGGTETYLKAAGNFTVSVVTSSYGTTTGQILRYTRNTGTWTDIRVGSRVSVVVNGGTMNVLNVLDNAKILYVDPSLAYFDVAHEAGVADAGKTGDITVTLNYVAGNVSGGDQTYVTDGFEAAAFYFDADGSKHRIAWVDVAAQEWGLETLYTGGNTGTDAEFTIDNLQDLSWSDSNVPGVVSTQNFLPVPDRITAIMPVGRDIILVCEDSIHKVSADNVAQGLMTVHDSIGSRAPYSVVQVKGGMVFWDGSGFSFSNGVNVDSLTETRVDDTMKAVNRDMEHNIRVVYLADRDRVECYFPINGSITNNASITINLGNGDVYLNRWVDCNAVWVEKGVDGQRNVFHGSSARHTNSGKSYIWEHREDEEEDGLPEGSGFELQVTDITNLASGNFKAKSTQQDVILGTASTFPYLHEGGPCTVLRIGGTQQYQFAIKKLEFVTPSSQGSNAAEDTDGYILTDSVAKFNTDPAGTYGPYIYRTIHNLTEGSQGFIYKVLSETTVACAQAFGAHSGSSSATVLYCPQLWMFQHADDALNTRTIKNLTDGSEGTITGSDASERTITCSGGLSGGTNNEWRSGDDFIVEGLIGGAGDNEWDIGDTYAIGSDYNIYYDTGDYDLSDVAVGDFAFVSIIPFSFGWKWLDFGSPAYKHHIKGLHVDFEPGDGAWVLVDHALDSIPGSLKTTAHWVDSTTTKLVSRFNNGKGYTYGYRIRCWSQHRINIHNVSIEFTTIV